MGDQRGNRQRNRGRRRNQSSSNDVRSLDMQNIASISRSSGLEADGDALKSFSVQEEYRVFIQEKLDSFENSQAIETEESPDQKRRRIDAQENIMILFRKLREGILASNRHDVFAIEVYETSLYLACLFDNFRQATSVIPHLTTVLYAYERSKNEQSSLIICSLYHLVVGYPSQQSYRHFRESVPRLLCADALSESSTWLKDISTSLRTTNYAYFEAITQPSAIRVLIEDGKTNTSSELATRTFHHLIDGLKAKSRIRTWAVIRTAYREMALQPGSETRAWMERTLDLQQHGCQTLDSWLDSEHAQDHVRPRDGIEGRWVILKM